MLGEGRDFEPNRVQRKSKKTLQTWVSFCSTSKEKIAVLNIEHCTVVKISPDEWTFLEHPTTMNVH